MSFAFNELCSECSLSTKNFGVSAAKETNNVSVRNDNQAVNEFSASTFHKPFELNYVARNAVHVYPFENFHEPCSLREHSIFAALVSPAEKNRAAVWATRSGHPFEIFHEPFDSLNCPFESFHEPFDSLNYPFEILKEPFTRSEYLITRSVVNCSRVKRLGDLCASRAEAVRFTRLTGSR